MCYIMKNLFVERDAPMLHAKFQALYHYISLGPIIQGNFFQLKNNFLSFYNDLCHSDA